MTAKVAALSPTVREESSRLYAMAGTLARAEGRADHADAMSKAAMAHLKHAGKVEQTGFIRDALTQAAGLLRAEVSRFEPCPWVIGFANGVWDRGRWRKHEREDGFLSVGPVEYHPGADRSEWHALLSRMTGGDSDRREDRDSAADLARTLQDVAGYVLSGASTLRTIPWCYGPRGCGKSTLAELLLTVLGGESGCTVEPSQLADDASRERLGATLYGKRLVAVSEAGNYRISAEVLKTLSGSDSFPVRRLYSEAFTARPSHALLMVANDPPRMDAYDEALRERILVLPLTHPLSEPAPLAFAGGTAKRIEEVRRNPESALLRGFLAWAVEGLERVFRTQEIHRAARVEEASRQFWQETDPLTDFWETVRKSNLESGVGKTQLKALYDRWCEDQGIRRPLNLREWTRACRSRGLEEVRITGGVRQWLLTSPELFGDSSDGSDSRDAISEKPPSRQESRYGGVSESGATPVTAVTLPVEDEGFPDLMDRDPFGEDDYKGDYGDDYEEAPL